MCSFIVPGSILFVQQSQDLDLVACGSRCRLAFWSWQLLSDNKPIETGGNGHVQNPRRCSAFHAKSMRGTLRLKKVRASRRLLLLAPPEDYERVFQHVDRHIFGIVDIQRRGVIGWARDLEQI